MPSVSRLSAVIRRRRIGTASTRPRANSVHEGPLLARVVSAGALVARVEARETLPRQDAPAPLSRRHVPANVAVAEFPLQNDAESVTEEVEVGRVAGKTRMDDVDGIGRDIVLQTRPRFLTGAAAQYQKCHKDCCCAAHRAAPRVVEARWGVNPDPGAAEARPGSRLRHKTAL